MKGTFPRLLGYALVHRGTVLRAFLWLLTATVASVSGPYLIKIFIDDYLMSHLWCYGSRYFGGSVPHTGRGNRGTSRQPDSAHGQ
ncbi:MAG: hypothetical protein BECKG1743F_GA0114225_105823, partial [Candidatus Kentron sp. G]